MISGAQSFLIEAYTVCTILQLWQFGSQPRRAIDWDRTAVSSQFRESKWRKERHSREIYKRHFVGFCSTSVMGDKLAGEAQVKHWREGRAEESQNTWRCCLVRLPTLLVFYVSVSLINGNASQVSQVFFRLYLYWYVIFSWTHLPSTLVSFPLDVCFPTMTLHCCSRAASASSLPSALFQLLCIQNESPACLFF